VTLIAAALCGDNVNYWIGRTLGPKVFRWEDSRFFNRKALDRTSAFYERHGGKTIVIARFVPIVRTFVPFVAGIGHMNYGKFLAYSIGGALLWVLALVYAGYFFGNIPIVKNNLTLVIFGIIGLSLLPMVIEYARARARNAKLRRA
jgi:membrane-associated protein